MLMCRDLAHIASDYIDGELGTRQTLSVKLHLLMCRHCRTFINNLMITTEIVTHHSSARVEDELLRRIDERVARALDAHPSDENNQP